MNTSRNWTIVATLCLITSLGPQVSQAKKKILFEGYYKVSLFSKHVGYFVQRYELDTKKKRFLSTYFLKTNSDGGQITESLRAEASDTLEPLSYQYTALLGKKTKTIDANVLKGVLHLRSTENGKMKPSQLKIKKGTFFSTFLAYMIMQGPKGLAPGVKYSFQAIAEEEGKVYPGEAFVDKEELYRSIDAYKLLNTFHGIQFVNYVSKDGQSLRSRSPASGLDAELVATPELATVGMPKAEENLKSLFGNVPQGTTHALKDSIPTPLAVGTKTQVPHPKDKNEK